MKIIVYGVPRIEMYMRLAIGDLYIWTGERAIPGIDGMCGRFRLAAGVPLFRFGYDDFHSDIASGKAEEVPIS